MSLKSLATFYGLLVVVVADKCLHPPPAANYQNSLYEGRWYEIGKVYEVAVLGGWADRAAASVAI